MDKVEKPMIKVPPDITINLKGLNTTTDVKPKE